jgi:heterodisulfide reductase subunit A-like polyferredoxin
MMPTANESGAGPVGAVLVVGGGIAGIQASLDLSAAGYKVFLVERASALGGHMAMLDKTFPTNDCAMCTMSPRLVAVAGDRNIEIITQADLVRLQGAAGRLTATVRVRPRFVDPEKCTGCGDCAQACPVELDNAFNQNLDRRKAIHRLYPQAVPSSFVIERSERPRCMRTCPLGTNPQGYLALVRQRQQPAAGRVCPRVPPSVRRRLRPRRLRRAGVGSRGQTVPDGLLCGASSGPRVGGPACGGR